MFENLKIHVHFMGICGSGCASIALLAARAGYKVSGCDVSAESYYAGELKKNGIIIYTGHSETHLTDDVDVVAVSPALFDIAPDNPELLAAREKGILMTWQEFMGRYLQQDKRVIGISGTHGKTTTTFLTAEVLIGAGLDPNVVGGSVYKEWGNGGRFGSSDLFLCEADEFNRNFHHYHPEIAVMNNVEMDHPECYNNFEEVLESFTTFVSGGGKTKTVILNGESEGAVEVLRRVSAMESMKNVRAVVFSGQPVKLPEEIGIACEHILYRTERKDENGTGFVVEKNGEVHAFSMNLFGEYNVSNAVTAILIAWECGVSDDVINQALNRFKGVGRRFDKVGTCEGVPVFDDYAHHPTEIRSVLTMCRDYFPEKKLLAIFEPHQVSRLRLMLPEYVNALLIADNVIIAKTHLGREINKNVKPITKEEWEGVSCRIVNEEENEKICEIVRKRIADQEADIVIVIGAANSYKISRMLCE